MINFDRNEIELQEFFLFCVCVAGKTSVIQAQKLEEFLTPAWNRGIMPFEYIDYLIKRDTLLPMLQQVKLGQYGRLEEIFKRSIHTDLETVTVDELERIPGIGPKTSRFFIMHSRANQRVAALDTHILSWLSENVIGITVPTSTPQSLSRYRSLEAVFLNEADSRGITPEVLDLQIWNERSRKIA
jgi:hypothetical protein